MILLSWNKAGPIYYDMLKHLKISWRINYKYISLYKCNRLFSASGNLSRCFSKMADGLSFNPGAGCQNTYPVLTRREKYSLGSRNLELRDLIT
jgi:hypothetical protein